MKKDNINIAIIGLGYVGLPLAIEFSKKYSVIGLDNNEDRIKDLKNGIDITGEVDADELNKVKTLNFTSNKNDLKNSNIFIVTVPTPIDEHKSPDLQPLKSASQTVGEFLTRGSYVIYESTVFPGCTEDECVPILESVSKLELNTDFYVGYSPERINPGDKNHHLRDIMKITSGSTEEASNFIDSLYDSIIDAGTHKAESIKVAEAAKVIENTQRDLNIALINELAMLFDELNISTKGVLEAASTKWNFLPFKPGLVGGHCIGVDPYYLTHKALSLGFNPELILAGRRTNDGMSKYVAGRLIKEMIQSNIQPSSAKILVMGLTFKENCPDIRNTKVIDLVNELKDYSCDVEVYDPIANPNNVTEQFNINLVDLYKNKYDAVMLSVAHDSFAEINAEDYKKLLKKNGILFDLKNILPENIDCIRL